MKMHDLKVGILIARYSKGDEISLLEEEYLKRVDDWEEIWDPGYYNKALRMISLAALFEIDKIHVKRMKDMLRKSDVHDWVFDFITPCEIPIRKNLFYTFSYPYFILLQSYFICW